MALAMVASGCSLDAPATDPEPTSWEPDAGLVLYVETKEAEDAVGGSVLHNRRWWGAQGAAVTLLDERLEWDDASTFVGYRAFGRRLFRVTESGFDDTAFHANEVTAGGRATGRFVVTSASGKYASAVGVIEDQFYFQGEGDALFAADFTEVDEDSPEDDPDQGFSPAALHLAQPPDPDAEFGCTFVISGGEVWCESLEARWHAGDDAWYPNASGRQLLIPGGDVARWWQPSATGVEFGRGHEPEVEFEYPIESPWRLEGVRAFGSEVAIWTADDDGEQRFVVVDPSSGDIEELPPPDFPGYVGFINAFAFARVE